METLFVGFVEKNPQLSYLGLVDIYMTFHCYLIIIVQVYSIVGCVREGHFTGVLIHQALTYTDDTELIQKVASQGF